MAIWRIVSYWTCGDKAITRGIIFSDFIWFARAMIGPSLIICELRTMITIMKVSIPPVVWFLEIVENESRTLFKPSFKYDVSLSLIVMECIASMTLDIDIPSVRLNNVWTVSSKVVTPMLVPFVRIGKALSIVFTMLVKPISVNSQFTEEYWVESTRIMISSVLAQAETTYTDVSLLYCYIHDIKKLVVEW